MGSRIAGTGVVWDARPVDLLQAVLGTVLLTLVGFTLGLLIRSSAGAIVAFFAYTFVVPPLLALLALKQSWFRDAQPWVDPKHNQDALFHGALTAAQWAHLGVTSLIWLAVPMVLGFASLVRSEVK